MDSSRNPTKADIMGAWRQLLKSACTRALPSSFWMTQLPATAKQVALTFDDGPDPTWTPRVLDQLAEADVVATFFLIGHKAAQHPDLVQRMLAEGHAIGQHSYYHHEPARTSAKDLLAEVELTGRVLEQLTGQRIDLFRPPKGQLTFGKILGLWWARQTVALWNVDPRDYRMQDVRQMVQWCASYVPHAGDIILLHDRFPYAAPAVPLIADRVRAQGLDFVPLLSRGAAHSPAKSATRNTTRSVVRMTTSTMTGSIASTMTGQAASTTTGAGAGTTNGTAGPTMSDLVSQPAARRRELQESSAR